MSGTDSSPESVDEENAAAGMRPTRGIEPPAFGYGPPPPPDFGIVRKPRRQSPRAAARPAVTAPQSATRPWAMVAIVAAIVAVLALVLGLVVLGVGNVLSLDGEDAPSFGIDDSSQSDPGSGPGAVESALQAKIDEYKAARDNGALWNRIPDTEFNRTAVSAFLYFLTDMRLAASFGADTSDYLAQADELERKLLNEEPLGSDISIKLSDRTFTYDGETGKGGYTAN